MGLPDLGMDLPTRLARECQMPKAEFLARLRSDRRIRNIAGPELAALLLSTQHGLCFKVVNGVGFLSLLWGEGLAGVGKDLPFEAKHSVRDAVLLDTTFQFLSVTGDAFGVVQLQAALRRGN